MLAPLIASALFSTTTPQNTIGERYAILVGIDSYREVDDILSLNGAATDAEELGKALVRVGSFKPENVTILTTKRSIRPTRKNIIRAYMNVLSQAKNENDLIFIYVAGHGLSLGRNAYFLPWDTETKFINAQSEELAAPAEWAELLSASSLTQLGSTRVRNIVAAFDVCRTYPLLAKQQTGTDPNKLQVSMRQALISVRGSNGSVNDETPTAFNSAVFLACQPQSPSYEVSVDGTIRGAFSKSFEDALTKGDANKDGQITVQETESYLRQNLPKLVNGQKPDVTIQNAGDLVLSRPKLAKAGEIVVPDPKFIPTEIIEPETKTKRGVKTIETFRGAYKVTSPNEWTDIESGEGGFTARMPEKVKVQRKVDEIKTPNGVANLIGYYGEKKVDYDLRSYAACYVDVPVGSKLKKEQDLVKWGESFVKAKDAESELQSKVAAGVLAMFRQKGNGTGAGLDAVTGVLGLNGGGGILGQLSGALGGKKSQQVDKRNETIAFGAYGQPGRRIIVEVQPREFAKVVEKAPSFDLMASLSAKYAPKVDDTQNKIDEQKSKLTDDLDKALGNQRGEDMGANGYMYTQVIAVGRRVFFLTEAYSLKLGAGYPYTREKFINSFAFLENQ